ncbi:Polyphosphoinositide phosphatase [Vanrija pseudolonga]|uniref:Polyphosphoinositide phosphatase n=1 Tax=Vanrija pseudolonga TaxID=143232 RepID=A0AAF0Y1H8_9TREE|nr:Polyphosphoinositide phosphatase [Vanrija pseudolonga]
MSRRSMDDTDDPSGLSQYTLYETKSRYYITSSAGSAHRVLKIDRTDPDVLNVVEDATHYDTQQLDLLLRMVEDGNKSQGGLAKLLDFYGIVGFARFTSTWYLVVITQRSVVGLIGGHYTPSDLPKGSQYGPRGQSIFDQVDLSKNFYFSYSYDITNTLQVNLTTHPDEKLWNSRFMWNYHLLTPAFDLEDPKNRSQWVLPLIHGSFDQTKINVFSRTVYLTLIARRSRHHAGVRFLTRGADENGDVANEVETEQIVSEPLATAFGYPTNPEATADYSGYTSFVQIRGSIPVMWHQTSDIKTPKPPIEITIKDPFYTPAAKHFDDLLGRYGAPIFILNLVKSKETVPRESKLLAEYGECVEYLNQFLPEGKRMRYIAWDMAQAAKSRHQDVMGILEDVCEESLQHTHFFHGGAARNEPNSGQHRETPLLQCGVLRVNCVDCLDRTNAAQFAIAKRAFGHQLYALGLLSTPNLPFACDAVEVLTEMYHDHGDFLAYQYTGSAVVNRDTYRPTKATQWTSHSRDLAQNIRRYFNNSILDADKQAAINLFLGVDTNAPIVPRGPRPNYRTWFTRSHLDPPRLGALGDEDPPKPLFTDYYKPETLTQMDKLYAYEMTSTLKFTTTRTKNGVLSPFETLSALGAGPASPTSRTPETRRTARRFAHTGSPTKHGETPPSPTEVEAELPSAVQSLVNTLLDPPDLEQRIRDYDYYMHYHTIDLLSDSSTAEPQDLQRYVRAAQLAAGQEVTEPSAETPGTLSAAAALQEGTERYEQYEPPKASVTYYENWLHT